MPELTSAPTLELSTAELLSTTKAVRKRLDLTRPVPEDVIRECLRLAMQAPAGSNIPRTRFVVIRDRATIAAMADTYNAVFDEMYRSSDSYVRNTGSQLPAGPDRQAPTGRNGSPTRSTSWLSIWPRSRRWCWPCLQACALAARAHGLGTCWTTMHLFREREVADLLGIPYDLNQQVCLTPLACTVGTSFRAAPREEPDAYIHWDRWDPAKHTPQPWAGLLPTDT